MSAVTWLVVATPVFAFAGGVFGVWLVTARAGGAFGVWLDTVSRGGYASAPGPVSPLPKAPPGPAPGARLKLPSEMRDLLPERDMVAEAVLLRRMAGIFQEQLPDGFAPADRPGIRMAVMMLHSFADESERQAQAEAIAKARR